MNSLAALTCEDILQGILNIQVPAKKGAAYARWISIFFGIFSFAFIFVIERLGSVLEVISLVYNLEKKILNMILKYKCKCS